MAVGTNHALAITSKGKCFVWGAGNANQLARRVVERTATGALIPREFGLDRKKIVHVGSGDYHSLAVDDKGNTYSWGLNSFGQTGFESDDDSGALKQLGPRLVEILKGYDMKEIAGGSHHSLACTQDGKILVWGRIDNSQGGLPVSEMPKDSLHFDEAGAARYLTKALIVPGIHGTKVSTAGDTCCVVDVDGKAYTWGFNETYQTGQGASKDVVNATLLDNTAVRGKKLVVAGMGGQFGVLGGIHEDTDMPNGV